MKFNGGNNGQGGSSTNGTLFKNTSIGHSMGNSPENEATSDAGTHSSQANNLLQTIVSNDYTVPENYRTHLLPRDRLEVVLAMTRDEENFPDNTPIGNARKKNVLDGLAITAKELNTAHFANRTTLLQRMMSEPDTADIVITQELISRGADIRSVPNGSHYKSPEALLTAASATNSRFQSDHVNKLKTAFREGKKEFERRSKEIATDTKYSGAAALNTEYEQLTDFEQERELNLSKRITTILQNDLRNTQPILQTTSSQDEEYAPHLQDEEDYLSSQGEKDYPSLQSSAEPLPPTNGEERVSQLKADIDEATLDHHIGMIASYYNLHKQAKEEHGTKIIANRTYDAITVQTKKLLNHHVNFFSTPSSMDFDSTEGNVKADILLQKVVQAVSDGNIPRDVLHAIQTEHVKKRSDSLLPTEVLPPASKFTPEQQATYNQLVHNAVETNPGARPIFNNISKSDLTGYKETEKRLQKQQHLQKMNDGNHATYNANAKVELHPVSSQDRADFDSLMNTLAGKSYRTGGVFGGKTVQTMNISPGDIAQIMQGNPAILLNKHPDTGTLKTDPNSGKTVLHAIIEGERPWDQKQQLVGMVMRTIDTIPGLTEQEKMASKAALVEQQSSVGKNTVFNKLSGAFTTACINERNNQSESSRQDKFIINTIGVDLAALNPLAPTLKNKKDKNAEFNRETGFKEVGEEDNKSMIEVLKDAVMMPSSSVRGGTSTSRERVQSKNTGNNVEI